MVVSRPLLESVHYTCSSFVMSFCGFLETRTPVTCFAVGVFCECTLPCHDDVRQDLFSFVLLILLVLRLDVCVVSSCSVPALTCDHVTQYEHEEGCILIHRHRVVSIAVVLSR